MTLPASGALTLDNIQTEFGGTNPIGLSEYYAGGGRTPAGTSGTYGAVPASGALTVQNFYGTSNYIPVYVEELFSTYTYKGTGSIQTITNDITLGNGFSGAATVFNYGDRVSSISVSKQSDGNLMLFGTSASDGSIKTIFGSSAAGSWSDYSIGITGSVPRGALCAFSKYFVATNAGLFSKSTASADWSQVFSDSYLQNISLVNGILVALYTGGQYGIRKSTDGITFTSAMPGNANRAGRSIVYSNGTYYLYEVDVNNGTTGYISTSTDLTNFSQVASFSNTGYTGTLAVGAGKLLFQSQDAALLYYSANNGATWTSTGITINSSSKIVFDGLKFIVKEGTRIAYSSNGVDWNYMSIPYTNISKIDYDGTNFYFLSGDSLYQKSVQVAGSEIISGKGGLVWLRTRAGEYSTLGSTLLDTVRGAGSYISSNSPAAEVVAGTRVTAFNSKGFTLDTSAYNQPDNTYVSWTFREQPKFFDVVTYTGTGSPSQTVAHNLGTSIGAIFVKCTSSSVNWGSWFRTSFEGGVTGLSLNSVNSYVQNSLNSSIGDSSQFKPHYALNDATTSGNVAGETYVAYLFASNAGGFGLTGTDNVITCGTFLASGANAWTNVELGYEPQWILYKCIDEASVWRLYDTMRGWSEGINDAYAFVSHPLAEAFNEVGTPTATGFKITGGTTNSKHVFIAIRRGEMKPPTDGTDVFVAKKRTGTNVPSTITGVGFAPDLAIVRNTDGYSNWVWTDRKTGFNRSWNSGAGGPINEYSNQIMSLDNDGMTLGANYYTSTMSGPYVDYYFKRAPKVFDIVTFTGTSVVASIPHGLQTAPQLILFKNNYYTSWQVYAAPLGNNKSLVLNESTAAITSNFLNNTTPTATEFTVSSNYLVNYSGALTTAYLFATCPGVSKVGSFVGDSTDNRFIDCGFTGGARFVLIKANATGFNWCVFNYASGMTSSNSPFLVMNSSDSALQSQFSGTLWQTAGGFSVKASGTAMNQLDYTYIYLAIA